MIDNLMETSHNKLSVPNVINVFITKIKDYVIAIDAEQIVEFTFTDQSWDKLTVSQAFLQQEKGKNIVSPAFLLGEVLEMFEKPRLIIFELHNELWGTIINEPREFLKIKCSDLAVFPGLLNKLRGNSLLWGAFLRNDELVFLLDLHRIPRVLP